MSKNELTEARNRLHQAKAELTAVLEAHGDLIAAKNGWRLDGLNAVRYFLMQKHHWTPAQLFAMSDEHLHFAMSEETPPATGK